MAGGKEGEPRIVPSQTSVELACDADLNALWEAQEDAGPPPARRITVQEALLSQTEALESGEEKSSPSKN